VDSLIFALTYHWLQRRIAEFSTTVTDRLTLQVTHLSVVLVTIWVLIRGYRLVTGASREPAMVLVSHMIKVSLIVFAAQTVAISGSEIYTFLNTTVPQEISYVLSGSNNSDMVSSIDQNLLKVSAATSVIDAVQVPEGDTALAEQKNRATWMATIGIAAPAMSAGALLMLYQIAIAMLMAMAPFFILCLLFDSSKELFRRWLMYLLSTLFSMAMLSVVVTWVMKLTLDIAVATWTTSLLASWTGQSAQGFNTLALQQGGIGLLMTVLIISTPPMAAMLFNGTMGQFSASSAVNGGGPAGNGRPAQQMGGGYGGGVGAPPAPNSPGNTSSQPSPAFKNPATNPQRGLSTNPDTTKSKPFDGGRYTS
jgi:type IV secretion system protein VirB6